MGGLRVVPFAPAQLADLEPPVFCRGQLRDFAAAYRPAGPAFSLVEEGRVLGCAGLVLEGTRGRAWAFLSESLRQRPFLLHRTVRRALPALARHYDLEIIDAEAHADFAAARQWLERLGFRHVETLPRFAGTTENYARYRLWVH
ncbi:MAG: hypothetical protein ACFCUW_11190 [Kiloniellaceae bacterium]